MCIYIYIYIHNLYINVYVYRELDLLRDAVLGLVHEEDAGEVCGCSEGGGDDTVGDRHRAQISQFELFELILGEVRGYGLRRGD